MPNVVVVATQHNVVSVAQPANVVVAVSRTNIGAVTTQNKSVSALAQAQSVVCAAVKNSVLLTTGGGGYLLTQPPFWSNEFDLTVAQLVTIALPVGLRLFLLRAGIYVTQFAAPSTLVQAVVSLGIPGNTSKYFAALQTSFLTAKYLEEPFYNFLDEYAEQTYQLEIATPALGIGTYMGRLYVDGILIQGP